MSTFLVRNFLCNNTIDVIIIVTNAAQIDRQLSLILQIKALNKPAVVLLNMADEAKQIGVNINTKTLSRELGYYTHLLSAKYGHGCAKASRQIEAVLKHSDQPGELCQLEQKFFVNKKEETRLKEIVKNCVDMPTQINYTLTKRIDKLMLHQWLGIPLFFAIIYLMFQTVYTIGTPIQDAVGWLLECFRRLALEPLLLSLPPILNNFLIEGIFDGLATVASFVPVIIVFFLIMVIIEDSGYLSRAAFLMDALMSRMGLDGRSFVMLLMGLGCNVPALMGTKTMRSHGLRLLTILVIPFSLCSARLQVFVFITIALFQPDKAPIVLFSMYVLSFIIVFITALIFKGKFNGSEPLALELPPYRLPTSRQMILRGWHEIANFLHRASRFIIIGVALVWLLTHMPFGIEPASSSSWAGQIGKFMSPILLPTGINSELTIALIFGFVAKEIVIGALAVIYGMEGEILMQGIAQQIDWVQAYSFMIFTLIYTPCLATIATIRAEVKSTWFTLLSLAWPLLLAWTISTSFYQVTRYMGY